MKYASLKVHYKKQKKNKIFRDKGRTITNYKGINLKYDDNTWFKLLKNELKKKKIILNTHDFYENNKINPDIIIHHVHAEVTNNKNSFLIYPESEIIYKKNTKKFMQQNYKKIFTEFDKNINHRKFIKVNTPRKIFPNKRTISFKKKKDFVLLASNKISSNLNNLYYQRIKVVKWFQSSQQYNLDLYGLDWELPMLKSGLIGRLIRKIFVFFDFKSKRINFYKGIAKNKNEVLKNYKYCFCFENTDLDGYFGDLIWDCFMAGTIPIYLGSKKYEKYIPKNCTISFRNFNNMENLIEYLNSINSTKYNKTLLNIKKFLVSKKIKKFSMAYNIKKIVKNI